MTEPGEVGARARWLDACPPSWARLLAEDPNAAPAHRPRFLGAVAEALPGHTPAFVSVEQGGETIGGQPLLIERRAALHWIHAMPFLLPAPPLAAPGLHARVDLEVARALDGRARELAAVGGEWVLDRPAGPQVQAEALDLLPGETRRVETARIELEGGIERAWAKVDRETRRTVRSARAAGVRTAEEPRALESAYSLYRAQARAWAGHRPRPLELLRRLLWGAEPAARLFTARDGRGLLAAVLVLAGPREWMAWWSGTHPEARRRHAFPLLLWSVAERAAAAGVTRLDLGGGAGREELADFKRRLGAGVAAHPVRWIGAAHAGPVGRLVARVQSRMRERRPRGEPA